VILSHTPPYSCKSKEKEKEKKRNINNDLAVLPSYDSMSSALMRISQHQHLNLIPRGVFRVGTIPNECFLSAAKV